MCVDGWFSKIRSHIYIAMCICTYVCACTAESSTGQTNGLRVKLKQILNSLGCSLGNVSIKILMTAFGCTLNKIFIEVIIKYFVLNYKFKSISVIILIILALI